MAKDPPAYAYYMLQLNFVETNGKCNNEAAYQVSHSDEGMGPCDMKTVAGIAVHKLYTVADGV